MENNKYNNSCIYKISKDNLIYIGSTCNYKQRMIQHKSTCNNIKSNSYNLKIYQTIRLHGGWDEFEKLVVQNVCCENREELREIEGEFIKNIGTLNCMIAGRSQKKYYEDNRDKVAERRKKYRENNRDKITENRKQYYEDNKDKVKQYYENNKIKITEQRKKYREDNKNKILEQQKEKIICPICSVFITKRHIKRHQRSKKCLQFLTN